MTSHPAATASTSRASESAPPDTPHTTGVPGGRERAARQQRGRGHDRHDGRDLSRQRGARRPSARSSGGARGSRPGWAGCPAPPRPVDSSVVPPARSTSAMKASPWAYWLSLASRPMSCCTSREQPLGGVAALAQHPAEAVGARDQALAGAVHGDVAVPLEQAHQAADLVEDRPLLGPGDQVHQAAVGERVLARPARRRPCGSRRRGGAWGRGRPRRGSRAPARGSAPAATARR